MKKILTTAFIILIVATTVSAQRRTTKVSMVRNSGKTTFGLRLGVNGYNFTGKSANGGDISTDLKVGAMVGLNAEVPLGSGFYLQPNVSFTQKGARYNNPNANDATTTLNYLDIPVNVVYKPIAGTGNLVLGVGPYIGFGLGGKFEAANGAETDVQFNNSYNLNSNAPQYKKTDAGVNFLAGYEFRNKLSVNLNAQLGLTDVNIKVVNVTNDQSSLKNNGFGLSLGYRF